MSTARCRGEYHAVIERNCDRIQQLHETLFDLREITDPLR